MHFPALHDRVVVRRIDTEEKSAGGIIIRDTASWSLSTRRPGVGSCSANGRGPKWRSKTGIS
jgi:co-chaperonin GroES (HSP10)